MVTGLDTGSNATNVLTQIKNQGYSFLIRYYADVDDFPDEAWKLLSLSESSAIANAGLKRVTVYQNKGQKLSYYTEERGETDASLAVSLARARGQNSGSAIYFAVDMDVTSSNIDTIINYFKKIKTTFTSSGYYVGVYGSGYVCRRLKEEGLVNYTWLSMSTGWLEYNTYTSWNIKQKQGITISGIPFDTNDAISLTSIGAW